MTGKEYLDNLSEKEYADFMHHFQTLNIQPYIDFDAWLESDDRNWVLKGVAGRITMPFKKAVDCVIVETFEKNNDKFSRVIIDHGNENYEIAVFPAKYVKET